MNKLIKFAMVGMSMLALYSCGDKSSEKNATLSKNNYLTYLGTSCSYIEHTSSNKSYCVFTVSIWSIDAAFSFKNVVLTFTQEASFKKYSLPANGKLTISFNSTQYSSDSSRTPTLVKTSGGKVKTIQGDVYR